MDEIVQYKGRTYVGKGWRTIAIILFIIVLLGSLLIGWLWNYSIDVIEKENNCAINLCNEYDAYFYDEIDGVCYCYKDGKILYQQYIG